MMLRPWVGRFIRRPGKCVLKWFCKPLNTLKARVRVSSNMIAWGVSQNLSVFPIDEQVVLEYTDYLVKEGAKFSALAGVIETCQLLHHVLGVDLVPRGPLPSSGLG